MRAGEEDDRRRFLTPSLRGVGFTSPYFHDGSRVGLREIVEHKTGPGARQDPKHDPIFDSVEPLTPAEVDDVLAFLRTLTGAPLPVDVRRPTLAAFPE